MQALPVIFSVASGVMGLLGSRKEAGALEDVAGKQEAAAEQARSISERNAARGEAETREAVRREKAAAEEEQSGRKARAAAGGGTLTGSTAVFLNEQQTRANDYVKWLEQSGASQAAIERERGKLAGMEGLAVASGTRARAGAARTKGLSSLVSGLGKAWDIYDPAG